MAQSPSDLARKFSPLILLAVIEVLVVALVPNNGSTTTALNTGASGQYASGGSSSTSGAGGAGGSLGGGAGGAGATGTGVAGGGGATTGGGTAGGAAAGGAGGGGASGTGAATGALNKWGYASTDTSHCTPAGLQAMPTAYAPQCRPVWHGGDNGGATMTGVDAKQIKFVYYISQANAQVNAILNEEQLAATPDQFCQALQAFVKDANKRFEFYGRQLVSLDGPGNNSGEAQESNCHYPYFQGQCSLTPPDPPCERAEADLIARQLKPAFVLVPSADSSFSYELAHDGIIVFSGLYAPESYHEQLAPYFYDVGMNGTQAADLDAEYYCKKLAGKPVQYAGIDVKGAANPPTRKLAIVYPENSGDVTAKLNADRIASKVKGCGGGNVLEISYASDINTAQQQSDTIVAELKKNGITDVGCWCDPIAPVFSTNAMDQNNYHPEIFSLGIGLLDYDALAQLYNPNVWRYAFGVSLLGDTIPFNQTNAVKAYNDAGYSGQPDNTENLAWTFLWVAANAMQDAGTHPTPAAIHQGLVAAPAMGGDPVNFKIDYFAPYEWSAQRDAREVWYCPTQTSPLNGKPGTYVPVDGGKRYENGQWGTSLAGVFPNGPCA